MMRETVKICSLAGLLAVAGCSYSTEQGEDVTAGLRVPENVSFDKNDYPVFPDADAGADPSVSAEDGGAGFTGEGWETNTDFDLIGNPAAAQGGTLRDTIISFPGTFRTEGPESNSQYMYFSGPFIYETLIGLHPTSLEYIPALATHWQISDDQMHYRFRLNPNARFSDGTPVTAEDVVATYDFLVDPDIQSPSNILVFGKLERPVAETKYIVSVQAKELNWRNFLYFGGNLSVMPAHILADLDGETYLRDYNFKLLPGSGPYIIYEEDIDKGNSVTMRRRDDYWAANDRASIGTANFDAYESIVVRDDNLAFEMFKKGELDYYYVTRSSMWVEELDFDEIQRGLIQKRKVFNGKPNGTQGLAFNTRVKPFDDIRVRKALTHLFNREELLEKLMYNEYLPQNSYYAGGVYENRDNPTNPYDPDLAMELLAEAGWDSRDDQGRLVKDGTPLEIEMLYRQQSFDRIFTPFQEDLRRVGIGLNLRLVTPETQFQLTNERKFQMASMGWGGLLFPNPETSYHSRMADVDNTNNVTGVKNARIDELCEAYDKMFNVEDRIAAIREIDGILASEYHYILEWYPPYERILYWNKFGAPDGYLGRTGRYDGSSGGPGIPQLWWIDPDKQRELSAARQDQGKSMEVGETEDRYWLEFEERLKTQRSSN